MVAGLEAHHVCAHSVLGVVDLAPSAVDHADERAHDLQELHLLQVRAIGLGLGVRVRG